ncbi:MAG: isoprenyl transferase [Desulfobacterales bacterium]
MNSNKTIQGDTDLDPLRIPAHVAIIMDGNGRWAKKRLLNRVKGHEKGSEAVRTIVRTSRELNIKYLTLYAFSTENWQRPKTEVSALMTLLDKFLKNERKEMMDNNIRLQTIGQTERLPEKVSRTLRETIALTEKNTGMQLTLALSYGSRAEIIRMVQAVAREAAEKKISPESITEDFISGHLYTCNMPDPDLLIRTSGEIRISNFLLWQIAYSEIFITDTLWPDFSREEYIQILKAYQIRDRRFGKIGA